MAQVVEQLPSQKKKKVKLQIFQKKRTWEKIFEIKGETEFLGLTSKA
jgi:hypothetical protein